MLRYGPSPLRRACAILANRFRARRQVLSDFVRSTQIRERPARRRQRRRRLRWDRGIYCVTDPFVGIRRLLLAGAPSQFRGAFVSQLGQHLSGERRVRVQRPRLRRVLNRGIQIAFLCCGIGLIQREHAFGLTDLVRPVVAARPTDRTTEYQQDQPNNNRA